MTWFIVLRSDMVSPSMMMRSMVPSFLLERMVDLFKVEGYNYNVMKIGFELKLGIGMVVVFGLLIVVFWQYEALLEVTNGK